uniref:Uncharacterized protein n=1 Tax=Wuchereria bancrofti TaxID=6293 RepID=A0AAF5PJS1_WUCBA
MQDQYREEEIEEFRELQRKLEQNAKNCRILQLKLRKSECIREEDLLEASFATGNGLQISGKQLDAIRIKELESELRIAKEVSVRLHNELENAEEKRYKLEDEVFYMKDKIRELQTQNKWREIRNRAELQTDLLEASFATGNGLQISGKQLDAIRIKELESELRIAKEVSVRLHNELENAEEKRYKLEKRTSTDVSNNSINSNNSKQIHDILEREADLKDQLKFAEEDLRRKQLRLQRTESEEMQPESI